VTYDIRAIDEIRPAFQAAGFARLPGFLTPSHADELRSEFLERLAPTLTPGPYGLLVHNVWKRLPAFRACVLEQGRFAVLADLLDGSLQLFQDHVICKPPRASEPINWHQDFSYWPLAEPAGLTLWIALDAATADNGCLEYLPGTHRLGPRGATDFVAGSGQRDPRRLPKPCWDELRETAEKAPLEPGDAVVHSPLVAHRSGTNTTYEFRTGYSVTLVSSLARYDSQGAPHPFNHELSLRDGELLPKTVFPLLATSHVGPRPGGG